MSSTPASFVRTPDQEAAKKSFQLFLMDPVEQVFVLSGGSGCGKSTLVKDLLDELPSFMRVVQVIRPGQQLPEVVLTATTNKAAENLSHITGHPVATIHSFLGLRVSTDFRNNTSTLVEAPNYTPKDDVLLFIDEASFIDSSLLQKIFRRVGQRVKIVFIGDPAQLIMVKATNAPVFEAGFSGAALTQVVRQAGDNPIVALSAKFRHTVNTGEFFQFRPDGHHIQHLDREAFMRAIEAEFTRPDWRYADSKILAWTNKCVVAFNQYVRNLAKGDPHFQINDYAICNSFLTMSKGQSIKTDQLVQITAIEEDTVFHGVPGNWVGLNGHSARVYQPKSLAVKNEAVKRARAQNIQNQLWDMERWADLRGAYASTINKSQGSTFDMVFIDLDDVARCNISDQLARMMYVAVSRARTRVVLTGDLA